jgi:hypothetical protein
MYYAADYPIRGGDGNCAVLNKLDNVMYDDREFVVIVNNLYNFANTPDASQLHMRYARSTGTRFAIISLSIRVIMAACVWHKHIRRIIHAHV